MPRCATRFLNTKRAYSRSPDLLRRAGLQDKEAIIRGMGMFRPILRKFRRIRSDRLVVEVSPPIPFFFSPSLFHGWHMNGKGMPLDARWDSTLISTLTNDSRRIFNRNDIQFIYRYIKGNSKGILVVIFCYRFIVTIELCARIEMVSFKPVFYFPLLTARMCDV